MLPGAPPPDPPAGPPIPPAPDGPYALVVLSFVADKLSNDIFISLTIYCSGRLPSLSFTIILVKLAVSTWNHFLVSGSLMKNWSPYLKMFLIILNIRVSNSCSLAQRCRY